jgi:hypothetical protein
VVPHIYAPSVDDSLDTDSAINSNFLLNSRSGGTWVLEFGPPCVNSQKTIRSQWGVIVFQFFGRGPTRVRVGLFRFFTLFPYKLPGRRSERWPARIDLNIQLRKKRLCDVRRWYHVEYGRRFGSSA